MIDSDGFKLRKITVEFYRYTRIMRFGNLQFNYKFNIFTVNL